MSRVWQRDARPRGVRRGDVRIQSWNCRTHATPLPKRDLHASLSKYSQYRPSVKNNLGADTMNKTTHITIAIVAAIILVTGCSSKESQKQAITEALSYDRTIATQTGVRDDLWAA